MVARVNDLRRLYVDPNEASKIKYTGFLTSTTRPESRMYQRVILISPPATLYKGDLPRCTYPLGPGYIAAVLERHGYDVSILDCLVEGYYESQPVGGDPNFVTYGINQDEIERRIRDFAPDVVGVSSIFSNQSDAVAGVFRAARRATPNAIMTTGGAHARYFPHNYIEDFGLNAVFLSESEATFLQYMEHLNGNHPIEGIESIIAVDADGKMFESPGMALIREKHRNESGFWAEIDHIPFPAWHLYNMEEYFRIGAYQSPYTVGDRVPRFIQVGGAQRSVRLYYDELLGW